MIRLCNDVDSTAHQIKLAIGAVMQQATGNTSIPQNTPAAARCCFRCGQPGHVARQCSLPRTGQILAPPTVPVPVPRAPGLCPRCKKGKHWANECRSKTDVTGNPLLPLSGNGKRAQPRGPTPIQFLPATGPRQPNNQAPSNEPPQAAQDWTSVPPPVQY